MGARGCRRRDLSGFRYELKAVHTFGMIQYSNK